MKISLTLLLALFLSPLIPQSEVVAKKPNVILIMTDDQGYGDLSCHGNPILQTPHLDQLYQESVRLTDFHVSPFCTPTRAALMTGRYPARTGAYRTSSGRTMMHPDERTIANLFAENGYTTGMVGKWHLGDAAPHRPQDRGFDDVVWHRCGGIGQASDYWGNDYFDDTYERNGEFEKFKGYCTDVWFDEATRFIDENREQPFFLYLAPNAPHGPYYVPPQWSEPYQESTSWRKGAEFYGMVANFDHNLGQLRDRLESWKLADNTILIFMNDNGTATGAAFSSLTSEATQGFNAGMRGKKSSVYEGGHRVPFFIHWPAGGLREGRDIAHLTAHIDVLPTLAEICGFAVPASHHPDGRSFATALFHPDSKAPRDHLIVQFQGGAYFRTAPQPWESTCILKDHWRLINGQALYNIRTDPAQRNDVSRQHPEIVEALRNDYLPFWNAVSPRMSPVAIDLGNPRQNPVVLSSQDWYMPTGNPPWNFGTIRKLPAVTGPWIVNITQTGRYRITLRQWPAEAAATLQKCVRARINIAGTDHVQPVTEGSEHVDFEVTLPAGRSTLTTYLIDQDGTSRGAYFAEVEAL